MRVFLVIGLLAIPAGCGDALDRQIPVSEHGAAVRANISAHVIDPLPPVRRPTRTDAARPVLAIERMRADETKKPTEIATAGDVSSDE